MATILVVEDTTTFRTSIRETLTRLGHQVLEATNGVDAINIYRMLRPDGVLMDIAMPSKDGIAALREIREFDPDAQVTMLTAFGMGPLVEQARDCGAVDFIVKPYIRQRLVRAIDRMLGRLAEGEQDLARR